jgi:peroxiredoxin
MIVFTKLRWLAQSALVVALALALSQCLMTASARAADKEYTGKLEPELKANQDELERVIFKPLKDFSKIKFATPLEGTNHVTAGRLYHAPQDKYAILALLVEPEDESPYLYVDLNLDNVMADNERFTFESDDDGYSMEVTLKLPLAGMLFQSYPIFVRHYKNVRWSEMKEGERYLQQSNTAYARGMVEIEGRKTLVQYGFNGRSKKISASNGWSGVDSDGDGEILMDRFSPEAAFAREETAVFRIGQTYVSTKRVDVEKNEIVLRAHPASDYKRAELRVGGDAPDFNFTDFNGKKRKLSDFRGKYVLIDFWGVWCPACIEEMPYLKAAYSRFQSRGFEILGMDTDENVEAVKEWLKRNGLTWTQARQDSIEDVKKAFRIQLYPSTLLVGPDGKIISLNQKGQPELHGEDLLKSLDAILPP